MFLLIFVFVYVLANALPRLHVASLGDSSHDECKLTPEVDIVRYMTSLLLHVCCRSRLSSFCGVAARKSSTKSHSVKRRTLAVVTLLVLDFLNRLPGLSVTSQQLHHLYSSFYYILALLFLWRSGFTTPGSATPRLGGIPVVWEIRSKLFWSISPTDFFLSGRLETFCKQATVTKQLSN